MDALIQSTRSELTSLQAKCTADLSRLTLWDGELEDLAGFAEKNKIKIAFNASSYLAEKGSHFLKEVLSRTEILVLNKEEAEMIVGKDSIEYLVHKLNKLGPSYVVITDGRNGAYCYHDNGW